MGTSNSGRVIKAGDVAQAGDIFEARDGSQYDVLDTWHIDQRVWTLGKERGVIGPASSSDWEIVARAGREPDPTTLGLILRRRNAIHVSPIDSKIAAAALKPPLNLIAMRALIGPSRVKDFGKKKHGHGNFYKATFDDGAPDRYFGGILRHYAAIQEPDGRFTRESLAKRDDESGLPEIDHLICGLLMLRQILTKEGVLPEDPGQGKEPA